MELLSTGKKIMISLLGLFTILSSVSLEASDSTTGDGVLRAKSYISDMNLGGFLGDVVDTNIDEWLLNALVDNPNIIQAIKDANSGNFRLPSVMSDPFGASTYYNVSIDDSGTKGHSSNALQFHQIESTTGGISDFDFTFKRDNTSITDWTGAEELWVYVNASEFTDTTPDLRLNFETTDSTGSRTSYRVKAGATAYIVSKTGGSRQSVVSVNDGYVPLPDKFEGWLGIPLNLETVELYWSSGPTSEALILSDVHQFMISVKAESISVGSSFYLDSFGFIGNNIGGANLPINVVGLENYQYVLAWDLEKIQNSEINFATLMNDYFGTQNYTKIDLTTTSDKGYSGEAIRFHRTKSHTGDFGDMDFVFKKDSTAVTDWTGAEELWVYVNASEFLDTTPELRIGFETTDSTGSRTSFRMKELATADLVPKGETTRISVYSDADGFVALPDKFMGWLCIPINQETLYRYWENGAVSGSIVLSDVHQFMISVRGDDSAVNSDFYLDAFGFVGSTVAGKALPANVPALSGYSYVETWSLENLENGSAYTGFFGPWYGEFPGKLLTGMSFAYKVSPSQALFDAATVLADELVAAQGDDGYLGVFYGSGRLTRGEDNWDIWNQYHCIYGLYLWYKQTGNSEYLNSAMAALDYMYSVIQLTDSYGGFRGWEMNFSISHAYILFYQETGNQIYFDVAKYIVDTDWQNHGDWLRNSQAERDFYQSELPRWESLHTLITLGYLYEETNDIKYYYALEQIWWSILKTDIHNTGGFTSGEAAVGNPYDLRPIETCCTVAWMALSVEFLQLSHDSRVADELERSYFNGLLGALLPNGKYTTYNTPMNGRRVPSQTDIGFQFNTGSPDFNCCQANIARGLNQVSEWGLISNEEHLFLNFFGESEIDSITPNGNPITLKQETVYPENGSINLSILGLNAAEEFSLAIRIPSWSKQTLITLNGTELEGIKAGEYYYINRIWMNNDNVKIEFEMSTNFWVGENNLESFTSVFYGPILLAADEVVTGDIYNLSFKASYFLTMKVTNGTTSNAWLNFELKTADGSTVNLVDFKSAGQLGRNYVSWLDINHEMSPLTFNSASTPVWQNTLNYSITNLTDKLIVIDSATGGKLVTIIADNEFIIPVITTQMGTVEYQSVDTNKYQFIMPNQNVTISMVDNSPEEASDNNTLILGISIGVVAVLAGVVTVLIVKKRK